VACFSGNWLLWRVSAGAGSCGVFRRELAPVACFRGSWLLWRVSEGAGSCGVFQRELAPVECFRGNWLLWSVSVGTGSCGVFQWELVSKACFSGNWLLFRVSVGTGSCFVFRGTCIIFLEELSSTARHVSRLCRIVFWDVTRCSPLKVNRHFGDMPPPSSGLKSKSNKKLI
jgi:hypothetical protein